MMVTRSLMRKRESYRASNDRATTRVPTHEGRGRHATGPQTPPATPAEPNRRRELRPGVDGDCDRFLVVAAFLDAAAHGAGALGRLLDDERRFAERTWLGNRAVPARELA